MSMTSEKILLACQRYKALITSSGRKEPEKFPTDEKIQALERDCLLYNRNKSLLHVLWMCLEIEKLLQEGKRDKAERWLCFIQGVLWMNGICSIDEMRDDNRE